MSVLLSQLKKDKSAVVVGFKDDINPKIKRRLLELGFVNGVCVTLSNVSFLNEVLLIELNGYTLSLRKDIAEEIIIKEHA